MVLFLFFFFFLRTSGIRCLLPPYFSLVPFSYHKIVDCLSFYRENGSLTFCEHDDGICFDAETSSCLIEQSVGEMH